MTPEQVAGVLLGLFSPPPDGADSHAGISAGDATLTSARDVYKALALLARNGYIRSSFTSDLIRRAVDSVTFEFDEQWPALSRVRLADDAKLRVEVLKHFTYQAIIQSNRVTVAQYRAKGILDEIFDALDKDQRLLPDDVRVIYSRVGEAQRKRVICDFIASMTDRYAVEFYGRLKSENPQTIFKPL